MANISKLVLDKQRSSESVEAAARTHGEVACGGIARTIGQETGQAAHVIILGLASHLAKRREDMVAKDDAFARELGDDTGPRDARDVAAECARATMVEMREVLGVALGSAYLGALGFSGNTPEDPLELERLGARILENVGKVPVPESKLRGYVPDLAGFAVPLQKHVEDLAQAREGVAREQKEADKALAERDAAVAAFDATFGKAATTISALLALGGEADLARKVRPSTRRAGVTREVSGEDTGAAGPV